MINLLCGAVNGLHRLNNIPSPVDDSDSPISSLRPLAVLLVYSAETLYSLGGKTSLRQISWTLEAPRFRFSATRAPSQYEDGLYGYGNFHYKDKTVVRPSYIYNENSYTGKNIFILRRAPGNFVCIDV